MNDMRGWSVGVGRWFGVPVRMHLLFVLLLTFAMGWSGTLGRAISRGAMLWLLLLASVLVREAARALTAACMGIDLRGLLLLPTGGIATYASEIPTRKARVLALAGPVASLLFALVLAGILAAVSPQVNLFSPRWVTPEHLLRAFVWINVTLCAVNLLPAWPLDGGGITQPAASWSKSPRRFVGPGAAVALVIVGMLLVNFWMLAGGLVLLLILQFERDGGEAAAATNEPNKKTQVKVRDVMLTEYSLLSASATLEDAVEQSRHTLQDVFPVVRGGNMVGAISRGEVLQALGARGNGYVQGVMSKLFHTASPDDGLAETMRRVAGTNSHDASLANVSVELVPVTVDDRIVGILTAHHLQRTVGLIAMAMEASALRAAEDERG